MMSLAHPFCKGYISFSLLFLYPSISFSLSLSTSIAKTTITTKATPQATTTTTTTTTPPPTTTTIATTLASSTTITSENKKIEDERRGGRELPQTARKLHKWGEERGCRELLRGVEA